MKLYTPIEINQVQQDIPYLIKMMEWIENFLARPHADLGRIGPVCPFVPQSLKLNSIHLAVIRTKALEMQQVEEAVLHYRNIFLATEPQAKETALNKAFLLIFPDIDLENTINLIDAVQQKLKPFFVASGLMIGEFHQQNDSPGLHNPNFRPLRSPIPMIAIRFMVESDLPFLQNAEDLCLRTQYLESYLQCFGEGIKDETKLKEARQALALTQKQLQAENLLSLEKTYAQSRCPFFK